VKIRTTSDKQSTGAPPPVLRYRISRLEFIFLVLVYLGWEKKKTEYPN
jgi:hypothetical protein